MAKWLRSWGIRSTLLAAAVAIAALTVSRALIEVTTSTVSEATVQTVTTAAPSTTKTDKTTTTNATGSDSLELGLLGTAALFALMAAFYGRLSKVTLPGGIGFELSTSEAQKLSGAVADTVRRSVAVRPAGARVRVAGLRRTFAYITTNDIDPHPEETMQQSAEQVASASIFASRYAQELLRLAGSESLLRARAADFGVTDATDVAALMTGSLTDNVRNALVQRAVEQAGIAN